MRPKIIERIGYYTITKGPRLRPSRSSHLFVVEHGERFVGATCEQPHAHILIYDDIARRMGTTAEVHAQEEKTGE